MSKYRNEDPTQQTKDPEEQGVEITVEDVMDKPKKSYKKLKS